MISFCLALLASCSGSSKRADLDKSLKAYVNSLRREDTMTSVSYVKPELRMEFSNRLSSMEELRFSNIFIDQVYPDEKLETALVSIGLEYYSPQNLSAKKSKRILTWKYDEGRELWLLQDANPLGQQP